MCTVQAVPRVRIPPCPLQDNDLRDFSFESAYTKKSRLYAGCTLESISPSVYCWLAACDSSSRRDRGGPSCVVLSTAQLSIRMNAVVLVVTRAKLSGRRCDSEKARGVDPLFVRIHASTEIEACLPTHNSSRSVWVATAYMLTPFTRACTEPDLNAAYQVAGGSGSV